MCHLVLLLPLLALPVFWFMPLALALPVYGVVLVVSIAMYWLVVQAMRRPVKTGAKGLIGVIGEVIESGDAALRVCVQGELWRAVRSGVPLQEGDRVKVVAVKDLTLRVQKVDADTPILSSFSYRPSRQQSATGAITGDQR